MGCESGVTVWLSTVDYECIDDLKRTKGVNGRFNEAHLCISGRRRCVLAARNYIYGWPAWRIYSLIQSYISGYPGLISQTIHRNLHQPPRILPNPTSFIWGRCWNTQHLFHLPFATSIQRATLFTFILFLFLKFIIHLIFLP